MPDFPLRETVPLRKTARTRSDRLATWPINATFSASFGRALDYHFAGRPANRANATIEV